MILVAPWRMQIIRFSSLQFLSKSGMMVSKRNDGGEEEKCCGNFGRGKGFAVPLLRV